MRYAIVKKRILSFVLAVCLVVCLLPQLPLRAFAVNSFSYVVRYGDWSIDIANTTGVVVCKYHGSATSVTIPSQIGGHNIQAIDSGTFDGNTTVKTITVPSSISHIRAGAFRNCTSLERVNIPSTTTVQTDSLFEGCTNLKYVTLPDSVEEIGSDAFHGCSSLASITLPPYVRTISYEAFWGCSSLTSIHLGADVSQIDDEAFAYCTSLQRFTVDPANRSFSTDSNGVLISKGGTMLYAYPGGRTGSYTVPADVTEIDNYAFKGALISEVHFASEDTELGIASFEDCTRLTYAEIPEAEWHMQYTFQGCTALRSISIPDGADLGNSVFENCTSLREVTFEGSNDPAGDAFKNVTATVYYPADLVYPDTDAPVWTDDDFQGYGGTLTWVPYCSGKYHVAGSGTVLVEPTCISTGTMDAVCELCGEAFVKTLLPTDHPFEYETVREVTCTYEGILHGTCPYCGETETKLVPMLPHDVEGAEPIYLDGMNRHYFLCNVCGQAGKVEDCFVPAPTITREPTLTSIGLKTSECTICHHISQDGMAYRISGQDRFGTSFAIAEELKTHLGVEQFSFVVLASGLNFPDALAGSYLAISESAPILLVNETAPATLEQWLKENLREDGTAYILGGPSAVSEDVETSLMLSGITTCRIAGEDRFGTNLAILQHTGIVGDTILVCTGTNFADSLSASASGLPIFLVNPYTKALTEAQEEFLTILADGGPLNFCIIGGTSAVPMEYEEILSELGTVSRISGSSRDETSRFFAERFCPTATGAALANFLTFPDGLCGGPLAHALGIPLLLIYDGYITNAQTYLEGRSAIDRGIVFGGHAAVSQDVSNQIFSVLD